MKDKLTLIREKCIAANPEIGQATRISPSIVPSPRMKDKARRPIRLADVLLAYIYHANPAKVVVNANKHLDTELKIMMMWNLRADDLEKQSEETISFLYELLR